MNSIIQNKKMQTEEKTNNVSLTAKSLWGKVVMYLREHNNMILHTVCGDITDVKFVDGLFTITTQQNVSEILNLPQNYSELTKAFACFGYSNFNIEVCEKALTNEDNIRILNKYFENKVNVITKK